MTPSAQQLAGDVAARDAATATAARYWGATACGGNGDITWASLGDGLNAQASWSAVLGAPASTFERCGITFNIDIEWNGPLFCTVMVHEMGHLLGQVHTEDPNNIMSPYTNASIPECGGDTPLEHAATEVVADQQAAAAASSARSSKPAKRTSKPTSRKKARKRKALGQRAARARARRQQARLR